MKAVIQCAGSKNENAGLMRTNKGESVKFVANPQIAPDENDLCYAKPDDRADDGESWRELSCAFITKRIAQAVIILLVFCRRGNFIEIRLIKIW